ncbi:MAG: TldD/PmbA family protein [Armatimonadota bacterium]|nr:TldD/PmbA family protein [bacterium]
MSTDIMMGERKIRSLLKIALEHSSAEQTEAGIVTGKSALTRFANSTIHQNMGFENAEIRVRAVFGKKMAAGTTNCIDEQGIRELVDKVTTMARMRDENPDFKSLPEATARVPEVQAWSPHTAEITPEARAAAVGEIISEADRIDGTAAGSYSVRSFERAVMNTLGVDDYYRGTSANLVTVVTGPSGGFGYASATAQSVDDIHAGAIGAEAAGRAFESRHPVDLEPGDYECILMPYAVCDMLNFMRWLGFNALGFQEGRSFLCGKLGQQVVSDKVSIWDDGRDPRTIPTPFDIEGVAKQHVDLIKKGYACGLLYDSYTAHREGKQSTGHASGSNLIMASGDATIPEMIANTRFGVMVTRFHYTNVAHLMTASITGMTRDGTFLIQDGKIVGPVKNLRFTQSITEALSNVDMIGSEPKLEDGVLAPALKVGKFRFSSATEF